MNGQTESGEDQSAATEESVRLPPGRPTAKLARP
jgi:hypothetical protein